MKRLALGLFAIALVLGLWAAVAGSGEFDPPENFPVLDPTEIGPEPPAPTMEVATFGAGCFWCTEAVFRRVKGVESVVSGYSGGAVPSPTYEQVCAGTTGHAEVVQVTFDPKAVSYAELLEVFWRSHDPTSRTAKGTTSGPQYRSVIFYHSDRQTASWPSTTGGRLTRPASTRRPLVTEIEPFTAFYPAGADHQDYYARTPNSRIAGP